MINEFFAIFRNTKELPGNLSIPYKDDCLTGYLRKIDYHNHSLNDLLVSDMFLNERIDMDMIDLSELMKNISQHHIDTITFHNVCNYINNNNSYITKSYLKCNCVLKDYIIRNKHMKNIRHAFCYYEVSRAKCREAFFNILKLGNKKQFCSDPNEIIERQSSFLNKYKDNHIVNYTLSNQNEIQAAIVGLIYNNEMYMILNNYKTETIHHYPNDLLYYLLYMHAKSNNMWRIHWGEVEDSDIGLQRFKKKYSNTIEPCISLHIINQ